MSYIGEWNDEPLRVLESIDIKPSIAGAFPEREVRYVPDAGVIGALYSSKGIDTRFLADIIVQFCRCVPSHSDVIERSNQSAICRCRFRPIANSELGMEPDPKTHYNFG